MSRLTLRLPETLHRQLEVQARLENVSLNQYLVYALTRYATVYPSIVPASEEDVQRQRETFQRLRYSLSRGTPDEVRAALDEAEFVEPEPDLDPELAARLRLRINEARETYQTTQTDE
ncbi:MAG: toxin-antitoxin system HicB family antitoxin [Caldilineales bacterium]